MDSNLALTPHSDPRLDLLRAYVTHAVLALANGGVHVERSWLDPFDPRDATIVCVGRGGTLTGLVWDEETGWRRGTFVAGQPGERTVLRGVGHLCGGLLPSGETLARRFAEGVRQPEQKYRRYTDLRDGLDTALAAISLA